MAEEHVCITDKDLQQMEDDLKNPIERSKIKQKTQEIQGCVFCKRKWMKYWAEKK